MAEFFDIIKIFAGFFNSLIDGLVSLCAHFLDAAASVLHMPITLYTSLTTFFASYHDTLIFGFFMIAFIALGYIVLRILINLL